MRVAHASKVRRSRLQTMTRPLRKWRSGLLGNIYPVYRNTLSRAPSRRRFMSGEGVCVYVIWNVSRFCVDTGVVGRITSLEDLQTRLACCSMSYRGSRRFTSLFITIALRRLQSKPAVIGKVEISRRSALSCLEFRRNFFDKELAFMPINEQRSRIFFVGVNFLMYILSDGCTCSLVRPKLE